MDEVSRRERLRQGPMLTDVIYAPHVLTCLPSSSLTRPARRTLPCHRRSPRAVSRCLASMLLNNRFWPILVRRSDGKLETVSSGVKTKNAPTQSQLNRTPDDKGVANYYRELRPEDPKHVDWRKKLAGMLLRELGGEKHAGEPMTYRGRPWLTDTFRPDPGVYSWCFSRELPPLRACQSEA